MPSLWMSKKLNSSPMALSDVRAAGLMVAASQSVYWILSSPSGSMASQRCASSSCEMTKPLAATALRKSSRVSQPCLARSSELKASRRSSTSLLCASWATRVRTARSKRLKCAKERTRLRIVLICICVDSLAVGVTGPFWNHSWSRAARACSRLVGSLHSSLTMRSWMTGSTPASSSGLTRSAERRILCTTLAVLAADCANGCWSVSTMNSITPMDHMSHSGPYLDQPRSLFRTSGATKKMVPTASFIHRSDVSPIGLMAERPKSMTLAVRRRALSGSVSRQFSNLRSRCATPSLWQYATALITSRKSTRISCQSSTVGSSSPRLPPVQSSVTKHSSFWSSKNS
mmetsp:Transcript_25225/g.64107  ORF Transcript_25225/g.64107 Transcript_25225/m.64107 type:complete len:344 (-) Transcript_25225:467-1498(-)